MTARAGAPAYAYRRLTAVPLDYGGRQAGGEQVVASAEPRTGAVMQHSQQPEGRTDSDPGPEPEPTPHSAANGRPTPPRSPTIGLGLAAVLTGVWLALTLSGVLPGDRAGIGAASPEPGSMPASVQPSRTESTPAAAATQAATPTLAPTPIPTPTELVPDQLGFVRLEFGPGSEHDYQLGIVPTTLVIGTFDGEVTASINAGQIGEWEYISSGAGSSRRWTSAPAAGQVLWAGGTQLHAVDVISGDDQIVFEAPAPIDHGAISPDGSTAFVALREESANWSVWRVDLQGTAEPELLRPAQPESVAATGIVLARTSSIFVRVAVAPDGASLAVEECGIVCRVWTMDLSTGVQRQYPAADDAGVWPLSGVVGDVVTDIHAYNLTSGERTDRYCVPALQTEGTAVLVCGGEYIGPLQSGGVVIDPRTGASRPLPLEAGQEIIVVPSRNVPNGDTAVELPAGWILAWERVAGDSEAGCHDQDVAWNIDTGDLVPLPGLGPACAL